MTFRNSIGARIFGLAVFLLALTIGLVGFLLWQVERLEEELHTLTHLDIPLANSLSRLDDDGLRRRLAFERTFGALGQDNPDQSVLSESQANYEKFTGLLNEEIARAKTLLLPETTGADDVPEARELSSLLRQIESAYPAITAQQKTALDLQRMGDHEGARLVAGGLNDLQRLVQSQRAELQDITAARAERVARQTLARQSSIVRLTVASTASAVLLGLLVAVLVTRALLRPVHSLIGALGEVQRGQLDLELPVRSTDELGALTTSFNFFVGELRAKEQMRETFGKYVDPRILSRLLDVETAGEMSSGREEMTVSFGDLVGFTFLSERLTPANMVRLLNRHFGLQAQAVQEHQGVVDKFIGDSIMSFWGPPFVAESEHALLACRAALAQLAAIDVLRRELPELTGMRRDTPEIDLRIGVAMGEVVVGNIGSEQTRSYTVIGDTVNVAARLEAANRFYGTRILVSDAVARAAAAEFELREIDTIAVKGKIETVDLFELLGPAGSLAENTQRACAAFAEGLRSYRAGEWDAAHAAFSACLEQSPADRPSQVMLDRIAGFRENVPVDWDGVWRPETK